MLHKSLHPCLLSTQTVARISSYEVFVRSASISPKCIKSIFKSLSVSKMDVEALVEAPFIKNGDSTSSEQKQNQTPTQNGQHSGQESPKERSESFTIISQKNGTKVWDRLGSSSKSHHRSPTPTSEHSRHSSSRQRREYDRHRDRDERDYYRDGDDLRHRRDRSREDGYRSHSRGRGHRDDRYYDDRDRYERRRSNERYRDRDDRYHDDRSDRRRSRHDDDHYDERSTKRRRDEDDRDRPSRNIDDRERKEAPPQEAREAKYLHPLVKGSTLTARELSPELTEEERDQRTVFVQQLAARLRTKDLMKFFEKAGPVREAQIVKDRASGRSKG